MKFENYHNNLTNFSLAEKQTFFQNCKFLFRKSQFRELASLIDYNECFIKDMRFINFFRKDQGEQWKVLKIFEYRPNILKIRINGKMLIFHLGFSIEKIKKLIEENIEIEELNLIETFYLFDEHISIFIFDIFKPLLTVELFKYIVRDLTKNPKNFSKNLLVSSVRENVKISEEKNNNYYINNCILNFILLRKNFLSFDYEEVKEMLLSVHKNFRDWTLKVQTWAFILSETNTELPKSIFLIILSRIDKNIEKFSYWDGIKTLFPFFGDYQKGFLKGALSNTLITQKWQLDFSRVFGIRFNNILYNIKRSPYFCNFIFENYETSLVERYHEIFNYSNFMKLCELYFIRYFTVIFSCSMDFFLKVSDDLLVMKNASEYLKLLIGFRKLPVSLIRKILLLLMPYQGRDVCLKVIYDYGI